MSRSAPSGHLTSCGDLRNDRLTFYFSSRTFSASNPLGPSDSAVHPRQVLAQRTEIRELGVEHQFFPVGVTFFLPGGNDHRIGCADVWRLKAAIWSLATGFGDPPTKIQTRLMGSTSTISDIIWNETLVTQVQGVPAFHFQNLTQDRNGNPGAPGRRGAKCRLAVGASSDNLGGEMEQGVFDIVTNKQRLA